MLNVQSVIERAESKGYHWDFYEDAPDLDSASRSTVPGMIVDAMREHCSTDRPIGLLTCLIAAKSMPAWFEYCDSETPLKRLRLVLAAWADGGDLTILPEDWQTECVPYDRNGSRIRDCRYTDTSSVSSAVAHAVAFLNTRRYSDAVISISHAYVAADVSPAMAVSDFEKWIVSYAVPVALGGGEVTLEQDNKDTQSQTPPVSN